MSYTIYELFDNFYNELTDKAIGVIETTDTIGCKDLGTFENVKEFNDFVEMYY